jgi:hypothetical protein
MTTYFGLPVIGWKIIGVAWMNIIVGMMLMHMEFGDWRGLVALFLVGGYTSWVALEASGIK